MVDSLQCPVCRISLRRETLYGVPVDCCGRCRGILLRPNQLRKLLRKAPAVEIPPAASAVPAAAVACPKCASATESVNYAGDSGIMISRCHRCSVTWLRDGQLESIARYRAGTPAIRRLEKSLSAEMRSEAWRRQLAGLIMSRPASGIFAAITVTVAVFARPDGRAIAANIILVLLALVWIWFAHHFGRYFLHRGMPMRPTPPFFVALGGWLFLIAMLWMNLLILLR